MNTSGQAENGLGSNGQHPPSIDALANSPKNPQWYTEFAEANAENDGRNGSQNVLPEKKPTYTCLTDGQSGPPTEKRIYKRFNPPDTQPMLYKSHKWLFFEYRETKNLTTAVYDLSEGGVRVITTERLKPGTKVYFKIRLKNPENELCAAGEVRWCRMKGSGEFFAGIAFTRPEKKIAPIREFYTSQQYRLTRYRRPDGGSLDFSAI